MLCCGVCVGQGAHRQDRSGCSSMWFRGATAPGASPPWHAWCHRHHALRRDRPSRSISQCCWLLAVHKRCLTKQCALGAVQAGLGRQLALHVFRCGRVPTTRRMAPPFFGRCVNEWLHTCLRDRSDVLTPALCMGARAAVSCECLQRLRRAYQTAIIVCYRDKVGQAGSIARTAHRPRNVTANNGYRRISAATSPTRMHSRTATRPTPRQRSSCADSTPCGQTSRGKSARKRTHNSHTRLVHECRCASL